MLFRDNHAYLSHTATIYPYVKEAGSFLFVNGAVYPYRNLAGGLTDQAVVTIPGGHERQAGQVLAYFGEDPGVSRPRTPVVAYGANANTEALIRKFVTAPDYEASGIVPVTQMTLRDLDVVWSPHFVGNGAVPATIAPSPGTQVAVWITWLDDDQLQRMHDSETVGVFYSYGTLSRDYVVTSDAPLHEDPAIYVDCFGAMTGEDGRVVAVAGMPVVERLLPEADALGAMAMVAGFLEWDRSPYELILDNLRDPGTARAREELLRARADFAPIAGVTTISPCLRA